MNLRSKIGLLLAPDLHDLARRLREVQKDLRTAEDGLYATDGNQAFRDIRSAVSRARDGTAEVLGILTGRE